MQDPIAARVNELLDEALELPATERRSWLDSRPDVDAALKTRLRALLDRSAQAGFQDFLGSLPAGDAWLPDDLEERALDAGELIGPYRLERLLGRGGMGEVWLATRADGLFERRLALKLPHRSLYGAGLADRFARERGILAGLEHPRIPRLYDAGLTDDGQPFLALEYVEGIAIDEYCRRHTSGLRERLELFLQVADAVAAAHARLIVHRDLKPANVLVTAAGEATLLDFGIAKLLDQPVGATPAPGVTRFYTRAFTPDYASPEQIRGEPVTIASDVYSLGVMLYELLTEQRPYRLRRATLGALEDAILDVPPRRPSDASGRRELRGDLDTIVLKALRKEPAGRYATVHAFADDVRRHLQQRPVLARPDSASYRMGRFFRRHALAASVAGVMLLSIVGTAGAALWQAHTADAQRRRAEEIGNFIQSIFTSADPFEGGGQQLTALDLLRQARARVDRNFADRPAQRVELLNTLTVSLANLSDYETADEVSRIAHEVASRQLPADSVIRREARLARLDVHRLRGRNAELRSEVDALLAEPHPDPARRDADRIRLLVQSAHAAIDEGRGRFAAEQATQAYELAAEVLPAGDSLRLEAAVAQSVSLRYAGELDLAEAAAERALEAALHAAHGDTGNARVLDARMALGTIRNDTGKPLQAVRDLTEAVAGAPRLYGPDSVFETFANAHLARAHYESGNLAAALQAIDRSLLLAGRQADEESRNTRMATAIRARILLASGDAAGARRDFLEASPFYVQTLGPEHPATLAVRIGALLAQARLGEVRQAGDELAELVSRHPTLSHWMIVNPRHELGIVQRLAGDFTTAVANQRASLAKLEPGARAERKRMAILGELGLAAWGAGNLELARTSLDAAVALHAQLDVAPTPVALAVQAARRELEKRQ